jgi:hypothetical protein
MTTKQRFHNKYRLQLREKDHEPMHVHLVGGDISVMIDLETLAVLSGTMPDNLKDEVMAWLANNKDSLIKEWKLWQR